MFGRLTSGLDQAVDSLMFAATGAVASLPLYLLRQANPNLANMLENTLLRYQDEYRLAVKSCRDAERQILAGENPTTTGSSGASRTAGGNQPAPACPLTKSKSRSRNGTAASHGSADSSLSATTATPARSGSSRTSVRKGIGSSSAPMPPAERRLRPAFPHEGLLAHRRRCG